MEPLRILIASTPVGPIGSGVGGGVELKLHSLVYGLGALGHHVEVVAPAGSLHVGAKVRQVDGALQASSQLADRTAPIELPAMVPRRARHRAGRSPLMGRDHSLRSIRSAGLEAGVGARIISRFPRAGYLTHRLSTD